MSAPVVRFERLDEHRSYAGSLTQVEQERRDRLRVTEDRAAYTAAHLLVRECAGLLLGVAPESLVLDQTCSTCGRAGHGRPRVQGHREIHVSLSHTRGCVAAMAARSPCGIDVERVVERVIEHGVPSGTLTPREADWVQRQERPDRAFTTLWVRKEARVKAGQGELGSVADLDVLGSSPAQGWTDLPFVGAWVVAPP